MRKITALLFAVSMTACASSNKAVIEPVATVSGYDSAEAVMQEALKVYEDRLQEASLRKAIQLFETAYAMDPKNGLALDHLTAAYYQLGYAYTETDAGKIALHDRGRQFALKRLEMHPGYREVIEKGGSMEEAVAKIDPKKDGEYVHSLQFAAANWGWWAEKTGISKVAFDIGKVKALFNRALEIDPGYLCSAPRVMAASFYAKAGAFGGDMEKARNLYEEAAKQPECYDNKMYFAEFYAIPMDEQELFHELVTAVDQAPEDVTTITRLENRVAKKKAKAFLAKEADLF